MCRRAEQLQCVCQAHSSVRTLGIAVFRCTRPARECVSLRDAAADREMLWGDEDPSGAPSAARAASAR